MANLWEIRKQLKQAIDWCNVVIAGIDYIDRNARLHDCNDCWDHDCKYKPAVGEPTRLNCPLWKGKNDE